MKPRYFRIDAVVRTFHDPETFGEHVEEILDTYFNVGDFLHVYEVYVAPDDQLAFEDEA